MIQRARRYLTGGGLGPMLVKAITGSAGLRIVGMGFGFLVGVQLARGLGPAGYGIYGTAMAVISLLMIPTELGLPQLVTREIASAGPGFAGLIVSWARKRLVVSSLVIALAAAILVAIGVPVVDPRLRDALLIGVLWIPIVAMGNVYGAALRGLHRVVLGQLGEFLLRPGLVSVMLVCASLLLANGLTPQIAMAMNVAAAAMVAILGYAWLRASVAGQARCDGSTGIPPELSFRQSMPIAMSEGMRVVTAQVSILILASMVADAEVGQYRVASQIYAVSTMPSALVNIAFAPTLAALHSQGRVAQLERVNILASVFLVVCAAIVFFVFLVLGKQAITWAFGEQYLPASRLLLMFLIGEVLICLFGYPAVFLNMVRMQKVVLKWAMVSLSASVGIMFWLVPRWGAFGAVLGVSVGMVISRAGCAWDARRMRGIATSFLMRLVKPAG